LGERVHSVSKNPSLAQGGFFNFFQRLNHFAFYENPAHSEILPAVAVIWPAMLIPIRADFISGRRFPDWTRRSVSRT
jgi:hypothetical protein